MINQIIIETIKVGIPVKCEYVPSRGFVYEIDGFYKSGTITIEEESGKLIATARYNEKTEIKEPKDIVQLNFNWWEYSQDIFDGWKWPGSNWLRLFDVYLFEKVTVGSDSWRYQKKDKEITIYDPKTLDVKAKIHVDDLPNTKILPDGDDYDYFNDIHEKSVGYYGSVREYIIQNILCQSK